MDLLQHHKEATAKIGVGVKRFYVRHVPEFNSRCFGLERVDGTTTDFSFPQCLASEKQRSPKADLLAAFRNAITEFKQEFKRKWFEANSNEAGQILCPEIGTWVSWDEAHVDHVRPDTFEAIAEAFITTEQIDPERTDVHCTGDNVINNELMDAEIRVRWIFYHRRSAISNAIGA